MDEELAKKIIDDALTELRDFSNVSIKKDELASKLGDLSQMESTQLKKEIFMFYAKRLKINPEEHKLYEADKIQEGFWKPMKKLLTALRVQEMKEVKVTRRKGKYDIKELRETYYGKKILSDIDKLGNRWMLSKEDYDKVLLQCNKLGLELPTVIEPTRTELFFEEED